MKTTDTDTSADRRRWLQALASAALPLGMAAQTPVQAQAQSPAQAPSAGKPFRIYVITFRGRTEVEKGFVDYLASRKIPVEIIYHDIGRDMARMPAILDEIRRVRPDLIYTWGTSVTLGVVGPYDTPTPEQFINDIPVLFTLVASPTLAKILRDPKSPRRNVSGVAHVGTTEAQMRAIAQYRPFNKLGVLYTTTEANSVAVMSDIRRIGQSSGFEPLERSFRLEGGKPVAEGAADLLRELKQAGAQWLYLPPDSYLGTLAEKLIIPAAMELGLPTFASTEQLMQAGALCGLVSRYYTVGQFTAHKAEQILVGKLPVSSIPAETLTRFSFQVRISAARRLALLPPMSMLAYAELVSDGSTAS